jgi:glycosyltransferase involved in cell wall biosynthesis
MQPDIAILSPLGRHAGRAHGGITTVITSLANALAEQHLKIELITLSNHDLGAQRRTLHPAVSLYPLGEGRRWQQRRRLHRYLNERRPAALLAAGHRANLLAAQQPHPQTRVLLSVHNAISPGLARLNPLRRWLNLHALRTVYPKADRILCVSDGVTNDLARLAPATQPKLRTQYNPIRTEDDPQDHPIHPWLKDPNHPVILGAGRLTTQKRFDTLIRAFAQVGYRPRPRLLILGEGPEQSALVQLAQQLGVAERVAFPGFVPNPRTQMAAAAVFVLSSAWEGFGNVLVEAMATGTAVIATDCPSGPREILCDGRLGPLIPVDDSDALAKAIDQTLQRPPAADALRARAADFAPACVAAQYLEHLLPGHTRQ